LKKNTALRQSSSVIERPKAKPIVPPLMSPPPSHSLSSSAPFMPRAAEHRPLSMGSGAAAAGRKRTLQVIALDEVKEMNAQLEAEKKKKAEESASEKAKRQVERQSEQQYKKHEREARKRAKEEEGFQRKQQIDERKVERDVAKRLAQQNVLAQSKAYKPDAQAPSAIPVGFAGQPSALPVLAIPQQPLHALALQQQQLQQQQLQQHQLQQLQMQQLQLLQTHQINQQMLQRQPQPQQQQQPVVGVPNVSAMLEPANALTAENRALIMAFLSGQRNVVGDTAPKQVVLNEEQKITPQGQQYLEQIIFEMNPTTGTWKKLRRKKAAGAPPNVAASIALQPTTATTSAPAAPSAPAVQPAAAASEVSNTVAMEETSRTSAASALHTLAAMSSISAPTQSQQQ